MPKKIDKRKFVIIAKVSNDNFVKYRANDIENIVMETTSKRIAFIITDSFFEIINENCPPKKHSKEIESEF